MTSLRLIDGLMAKGISLEPLMQDGKFGSPLARARSPLAPAVAAAAAAARSRSAELLTEHRECDGRSSMPVPLAEEERAFPKIALVDPRETEESNVSNVLPVEFQEYSIVTVTKISRGDMHIKGELLNFFEKVRQVPPRLNREIRSEFAPFSCRSRNCKPGEIERLVINISILNRGSDFRVSYKIRSTIVSDVAAGKMRRLPKGGAGSMMLSQIGQRQSAAVVDDDCSSDEAAAASRRAEPRLASAVRSARQAAAAVDDDCSSDGCGADARRVPPRLGCVPLFAPVPRDAMQQRRVATDHVCGSDGVGAMSVEPRRVRSALFGTPPRSAVQQRQEANRVDGGCSNRHAGAVQSLPPAGLRSFRERHGKFDASQSGAAQQAFLTEGRGSKNGLSEPALRSKEKRSLENPCCDDQGPTLQMVSPLAKKRRSANAGTGRQVGMQSHPEQQIVQSARPVLGRTEGAASQMPSSMPTISPLAKKFKSADTQGVSRSVPFESLPEQVHARRLQQEELHSIASCPDVCMQHQKQLVLQKEELQHSENSSSSQASIYSKKAREEKTENNEDSLRLENQELKSQISHLIVKVAGLERAVGHWQGTADVLLAKVERTVGQTSGEGATGAGNAPTPASADVAASRCVSADSCAVTSAEQSANSLHASQPIAAKSLKQPTNLHSPIANPRVKAARPPVPNFRSPVHPKRARPPAALEPAQQLRQISLPPKHAEDDYAISEDDDDESQHGSPDDKHVPEWCNTYLQALDEQAFVDPDSIFSGRVPCCDLASVFPDSLYQAAGASVPKRRRGSSGEWGNDRLTKWEIQDYKRKLEQTKCWKRCAIPGN